MSRIALFAAGLLATLALAAPLGAATSVTKLTGTVGPGFTITLKKGTAKVKTLKAGHLQDHGQRQVEHPRLPPDRARA